MNAKCDQVHKHTNARQFWIGKIQRGLSSFKSQFENELIFFLKSQIFTQLLLIERVSFLFQDTIL